MGLAKRETFEIFLGFLDVDTTEILVGFVVYILCDIDLLSLNVKLYLFDSLALDYQNAASVRIAHTPSAININDVISTVLKIHSEELVLGREGALLEVHQKRAFHWIPKHISYYKNIEPFVSSFEKRSPPN